METLVVELPHHTLARPNMDISFVMQNLSLASVSHSNLDWVVLSTAREPSGLGKIKYRPNYLLHQALTM